MVERTIFLSLLKSYRFLAPVWLGGSLEKVWMFQIYLLSINGTEDIPLKCNFWNWSHKIRTIYPIYPFRDYMVYPGNSSCILLQGKEKSLKILASEFNLVSGKKKKKHLTEFSNQPRHFSWKLFFLLPQTEIIIALNHPFIFSIFHTFKLKSHNSLALTPRGNDHTSLIDCQRRNITYSAFWNQSLSFKGFKCIQWPLLKIESVFV